MGKAMQICFVEDVYEMGVERLGASVSGVHLAWLNLVRMGPLHIIWLVVIELDRSRTNKGMKSRSCSPIVTMEGVRPFDTSYTTIRDLPQRGR